MNIVENVKTLLKEIFIFLINLISEDPLKYKILTLYIPITVIFLLIVTFVILTYRSQKKE